MNNILGVILSFVFVFLIIGASTILQKKQIIGEEGTRKLVHIGVSNWWFFVIFMFNNMYYAIIPPIIFIVLNYLSYKKNIFKSMERKEDNNLGTVYFPIALLILVIFSFTFMDPILAGIGILVLGYGDGIAAIIGKKYGKIKLLNNKTLMGSATMFIVSFIVSLVMLMAFMNLSVDVAIVLSIVAASVGMLVELITPFGLDNLSVPIIVSICLNILIAII
ncbi:diacylglycerol/polyprenol kinase family protein [Haploplasma axanthum]|uniref:Cytidylyltransferase family n=1 Tax=Haploplasma axanthum TaxID=29552 RepID=A0A449BFN3_HAPAX|nr:hypothetical protein [Haploplasma axanthum]VEU81238.1 Cytidylyltransferase family [Haploplasma axanthum]